MKTLPLDRLDALANKLRALENGFDPERADALLDELFHLSGEQGILLNVTADAHILRVQSQETLLCELPIHLAPAKLRSLCARLAVRCAEWTGQDIALHGANLEVEHPTTHNRFHIRLDNTPGRSQIELEPISMTP